jgi:hypothetical protein
MTPSATSSHLKGYQGQSPWLVSQLCETAEWARQVAQMDCDPAAGELWQVIYRQLADEIPDCSASRAGPGSQFRGRSPAHPGILEINSSGAVRRCFSRLRPF